MLLLFHQTLRIMCKGLIMLVGYSKTYGSLSVNAYVFYQPWFTAPNPHCSGTGCPLWSVNNSMHNLPEIVYHFCCTSDRVLYWSIEIYGPCSGRFSILEITVQNLHGLFPYSFRLRAPYPPQGLKHITSKSSRNHLEPGSTWFALDLHLICGWS